MVGRVNHYRKKSRSIFHGSTFPLACQKKIGPAIVGQGWQLPCSSWCQFCTHMLYSKLIGLTSMKKILVIVVLLRVNWTLGIELDFGPKSNSVQSFEKRLWCRYLLVTLDAPFNLFLTSASTHQPIPEEEGGSSLWVLLITSWIDQAADWITPSFGLCKAALSSQYRIDWGQVGQVSGRKGTVNWFQKRIYLFFFQQKT